MALIPQVYYGFRDKTSVITYSASIPTFIGLSIISFTFWTLALSASALITAITGTLWFLFFVQRLLYHKK